MPTESPGCYLCFWLAGYKSKIATTPSLGSIKFLEQFMELRKPVYLLNYWFIAMENKEYKSKRCRGKVWGKGTEFPCPLLKHHSPLSPNLHMLTNPEVSKPHLFGFLWRFHYIAIADQIIGHCWFNSISSYSLLPAGPGEELKFPVL